MKLEDKQQVAPYNEIHKMTGKDLFEKETNSGEMSDHDFKH